MVGLAVEVCDSYTCNKSRLKKTIFESIGILEQSVIKPKTLSRNLNHYTIHAVHGKSFAYFIQIIYTVNIIINKYIWNIITVYLSIMKPVDHPVITGYTNFMLNEMLIKIGIRNIQEL